MADVKPSGRRLGEFQLPHSRMHLAIIQLFENTLNGSLPSFTRQGRPGGFHPVPPIDVSETGKAVVVETELPGVALKDVSIHVEGDILLIRSERREEERERARTFYRQECQYGRIEQKIMLPLSGLSDHVEVTLANGVLKVTLPKNGTGTH